MTILTTALASFALAQPVPTPAQAAWHDLEVGMFIHIAPQTWQDRESDDLSTPLSAINPAGLDTDEWVRVAKEMGAGYIVFVAKHEGGFCWWQTETTDHGVANTPWRDGRGDVMADLAQSCREAGIGLGVYLSPQDRAHGVGVGGRASDPAFQARYEELFRRQLTELLTRYGDVMEVWFDGSLAFDVGDILSHHAPNAVVFQGPQATIRWVGNEDGIAPYPAWNTVRLGAKPWGEYTAADGDPDGDRWLPNECDARIRATWFWKSFNADTLKPVEQLMDMYERSVGHGGVLLLNHAPDPTGRIPELDAKRSREFGEAVRKTYGTALADTSGKVEPGGTLVVQPSAPVEVDRIVIAEDIREGERVRAYEIEALLAEPAGAPEQWVKLAEGTAIGHKRIQRLDRVRVSAIRLRITAATGSVSIRRLALHATP